MELQEIYFIAEIVAAIAVVVSLIFVGLQMRQSNRVNMASARHSVSEHALQLISFQATNADRLARVLGEETLNKGDALFIENYYRMGLQLAENYHTQFQLGLMPEDHWTGFAQFIEDSLQTSHAADYWARCKGHYGGDFAAWIDGAINSPKLLDEGGQADESE